MGKVTWLLVVSLLYCICYSSQAKNSRFRWRRPAYVMPWLKGPNVCAVEEIMGTGKRYYSDCIPNLPRKICGKKTFVRYHCCTGFEKTGEEERGCLGVTPIRNLMETAKHLYLEDFRKYAIQAGLYDKFTEPAPYTLFIPHRTAFKDISPDTKALLATNDQSRNLLRMHAAEGRYFQRDLLDGTEIPSLYYYQDEGLLKINKYRNGIRTVNCVRLILTDQVATNGIIHITEKVIEPFPNRGSIMDILLRDDRFGELVTALIVSDEGNELRDSTGHYTIFAPTDTAFRSAPTEIMNRILSDKELVKQLLRYHQIPKHVCSSAILGPERHRSREGQILNLTCDVDDNIRVNNVPVSETDIVAFNGVIHVIDELLVPDSVKSIGDIINELEMGKFIEYAQQAGLQDVLSGEAQGNYTIFVPRPEAFEALTDDQKMKLQTDSAFVKETIRYHVVPEIVTTHDMNDGQALDTLYKAPLKAHIFQRDYGVNSAKIVSPNHESSNGVVHIVDKVLFPPVLSAMEIIKQDPRLSTFESLLETSGLASRLDGSGHFTILAPSNAAFDRMPTAFMEMLVNDGQELAKAVGYHILKKPVFSSNLKDRLQYRFPSVSKSYVKLRRAEEGQPVVVDGVARVEEADIESTSGVIHIIDDVLRCPCVEGFQNDSWE